MGDTSPSQLGSSTTKRRPRWIGRLLPLVFSLLATPAYSASNTDVQWIARWLDDGTGTGIPAEQAEVQAASPKRFYAAGEDCTLLDENNTTGTFGPYSAGNDCVLGEGPGRGQDADWDNILRLNIRTNNSACNINATLTFKVGAFELDVDWEYCEFQSQGGAGLDELLYSFPVPQRSAFADGVEAVEVFIPDNSTQRIGWWRFPPPPVPVQCSEVTDWQAAADTVEWTCTHDGTAYEYADFHILTTIDSQPDVCSTPANYLPTDDNNGAGLFCQQSGSDVRALFDWGWGQEDPRCSDKVLNGNEQDICLYWLKSASQFGSRAARPGDASGPTVAGRVPNQLANGKWAFARFAGEGGSGFQSLDTSNLTSLSYVFARATSFNEDISAWDTSKVTELNRAFWLSGFDRPIPTTTNGSAWDVSQVRNFDGAFTNSFNQDLSSWNVGNARQLSDMFKNNHHFNQNLSAWADKLTELVTMENMFNGARAFNNGSASGASDQPLSWGATPKLTKMNYTFASATSFNQQIFADGARTAGVDNMAGLFKNATAFNRDIGDWNTQSLQKTASMFEGATAFNKDIGSWSMDSVTNMNAMFKNAEAFNQDIGAWNTENVTNMSNMFINAASFNQDLSSWDVRSVTDYGSFDLGADAWCGLGFENQGRPSDWEASAAGCRLNLYVTTEPQEEVATGSTVLYTAKFSNNSTSDASNATLTFDLPSGTTVNSASTPITPNTESATQLAWTGLTIPKGSDGGEILIGIDVPSSFTGDTLTANTTLAVTGASADKDTVLGVVPGGEPAFAATLDAPNYALAGTALTYQLSVSNIGTRDADNATVTLTWNQDNLIPESSGGNCSGSPLTCSWSVSLAAEDEGGWDTSLAVNVPATADFGDVISAQLTVSDAGSDATGGATAATTVNSQPDLVLVLTSSPRRVVAPGAEVEMTMALKNVGTAPAKDVVLTLPTSTATFASADPNPSASGDDVVWPAITTLASDATTTYTATLTAGADDSVIQTQASVAGTTEGGSSVSDTSNLITLRVANEADPVLTAAFDPENFVPGKDIALTFTVANEGSAQLSAGTLVVPLPKDTSVATVPTGATCTATACTLPVAALAAGGSTAATVPLTVDAGSSLTRLAGAGALKPDTAGAFIAQSATATADLQITSDTKEPYEITIDPPADSGCSLTSVSTQQDAGVSGVTLVRDELLNFAISGCDSGTAVPVAITVQGDALPEGTVAIKADDSGVSGAQITGATITGNTVRYTLTDNGSLDLDPDDGELRDPVAVAIVGGSGIYVPFIPVPIPYWVLGLLAGLMGYLGFRRLSAA